MSDRWRLLRGWSDARLSRELARARRLPLNYAAHPPEMTSRRGWNQVESRSLVAHEPPGPPGPVFAVLRRALERFEHSDPRIVVAHFDRRAPLAGRPMLLELIALALHVLTPVRVGAIRDEPSLFGYCLDTLEGHVEAGREWFLLQKDGATGAIRFRMEGAWRHGDFRGWWAHAGFELVGRRYQRAWHRLAHARMRRFAALASVPTGRGHVRHAGSPLPLGPVQLYAVRALRPSAARIERERTARPGRR